MKRQLLLAAALVVSAPASAALLDVTISGDYSAVFHIDSNPVAEYVTDGYSFSLSDVAGIPGATNNKAALTFFNAAATGGLLISDSNGFDYLFDANGAQLYAGTEANPLFAPGQFVLKGLSTPGTFLVTIAASVPEPALWLTMFLGIGLAGAALRIRRRLSSDARRA